MSVAVSPLRDRMIFNVGARRSGTYWLQRVVTAHPTIAAVPSETQLFSHGLGPLFDRFQHSLKSSAQVSRVYVADRAAVVERARELSDVVLAPFLEAPATMLAERSALHSQHLDLIDEIYPDCRVVHIIRDGRDVSRSIAAQDWARDSIEHAAREWRDSVMAARGAAIASDRYLEVRYERMLEEPKSEIERIFTWFGVESTAPIVEQAVRESRTLLNVDRFGVSGAASGKWRRSFDLDQLAAFDAIAGDLLEALGYDRTQQPEPSPSRNGVRRARERARTARARLTRLDPRRQPARDQSQIHLNDRQLLFDSALQAIDDGEPERLIESSSEDVLVWIRSRDGVLSERGPDALRHLGSFPSPEGGQLAGDVHPSVPTGVAVLRYEDPGGDVFHRTVGITIEHGAITGISLHTLEPGTARA